MSNTYTLRVTWNPDLGKPWVNDDPLKVAPAPGQTITVTWVPEEDVVITGISGLPSAVNISGPDSSGIWQATYPWQQGRWSYFITGLMSPDSEMKAMRHDPEIDNTPPPQPPGGGALDQVHGA